MNKYVVYEFERLEETKKEFDNLKQVYNYLVKEYQVTASYDNLKKAMKENYGRCALYRDLYTICIEETEEE